MKKSIKITDENYEEIKTHVAELEYELEHSEEDEDDELPAEVKQQRRERLAKMNAEYSELNDKLIEYELNK